METTFRIAAAVWIIGGVARLGVAATGVGSLDGPGLWLSATLGAALSAFVAGALWFWPGRGSAFAAVLLAFYAIPGILLIGIVGVSWRVLLLALLGVVAFALSAYCLWLASRANPGA